ncbi:MAG: hypothetical protein AAF316_00240 [Cyanobacteria bacterium P01_A01_bin.80]
MKFFNGTTHEITIYSEEDTVIHEASRKLILKPGALPLQVLKPGLNLSAQIENPLIGKVAGIEIRGINFLSVSNPEEAFPDIEKGDMIIVSNLYITACKEANPEYFSHFHLYTVGGTVYDSPESKRPVGCLYLIQNVRVK